MQCSWYGADCWLCSLLVIGFVVVVFGCLGGLVFGSVVVMGTRLYCLALSCGVL